MWASILSFVAGLAGKLLASLFTPKDPTPVDLAASNATAQTNLAQQEASNAIISDAARTRTDADAGVLRESAEPAPAGSPPGAHTALDADAEGHWRD